MRAILTFPEYAQLVFQVLLVAKAFQVFLAAKVFKVSLVQL